MKSSLIAIIAGMCLLTTAVCAQAHPRRGMFLTVMQSKPVLSDISQIKDLIAFSKSARIDTLFVQVYRSNQSWFPSTFADDSPYQAATKSTGMDPLEFLIREAHRAGIEVHAWMNLMSLSQNADAPILKKYGPEILTRNLNAKTTLEDYLIDRQYFLEPGDPRVAEELSHIIEELLKNYPGLDGIQFDYIRYPDVEPHYGYTIVNVKRFESETGLRITSDQSPGWQDWKRDQVTQLVKTLTAKSRDIHPGIQVSTTGCASFTRAFAEAFQDWPKWINTGLVDFVTLMSYPDNLETFVKNVDEARSKAHDPRQLNVAVPAYKLEHAPDVFGQQFDYCEDSDVRQCVVFHYGSIQDSAALGQILIDQKRKSPPDASP